MIINLVRELKHRYKPRMKRMKKTRGMTVSTEKMDKFCKDNKDEEWDHERFTNWIRKASKEEYHSFLKELRKLKIINNTKEFYLKMRFCSEIDL